MTKIASLTALATAMLLAAPAWADTWYEVQAKNESTAALTVSVNGSTACKAAAGETCLVKTTTPDAKFAYAFEGGQSKAFSAGNLEITDVCKFDDKGAHCIDTLGNPSN